MHAAFSLVLVVATTAIGLGLALLAVDIVDRGDSMRRPPISLDRGRGQGIEPPGEIAGGEPAIPYHIDIAVEASDIPALVASTDVVKSPLYPQNGVTLWDRIRVSSKRDQQAFLFGAAIQIHAPEAAATPGPR